MAIDLYKTRDLLDALEYIHVPGDFLLSTFVTGTETHDTDTIDIDIERNGKKMAPFVNPVREGQVVTKEGYQTRTHKIPYIKLKTKTTAQEALKRRAGRTMYNGQTPQSYANQEMGKSLSKLDQMIFRREEWMLAQALQTGKVLVSGEGVGEYQIDFGMKASHLPVLTGTDLWSDAGADIQADLADWADLVYEDSGRTATDAIIGREAAKAMLRNDSFIGALDRRRIDRGEIMIERLPKGVKYYGFDRESGLDLWGYTEKFDDGQGNTGSLIDEKKVVVIARGARCERHYGAIQNVETDFIGPRWPDNWITKDPSVHWVSLESAPLVAFHEIDAVVCAQVLA